MTASLDNVKSYFACAASSLCDASLNLLYPLPCAACEEFVRRRADVPVCAKCWSEARTFDNDDLMCWKCGKIAPGASAARIAVSEDELAGVRCRACESESFDFARSVGAYAGALRAVVLMMKHEPFIGERAIELMNEWLSVAPLNQTTRLVPVPLHAKRIKQRGFNQAAVLGEKLACRVGLPFDDASLERAVYTAPHRAGVDAQARRTSVENAFAVTRPRLVKNEKVLLIDDVFTTGSTVSACARALKEAGASDVFVLTLARAGVGTDV